MTPSEPLLTIDGGVERARLEKLRGSSLQIRAPSAANQARLLRNEFDVIPVTHAAWLR